MSTVMDDQERLDQLVIEHRARWIRDATLNLMMAEMGSERNAMEGISREEVVAYFEAFAAAIYDAYSAVVSGKARP